MEVLTRVLMDALTELRRPNLMLNQNPRQTPLSGPAREIFSFSLREMKVRQTVSQSLKIVPLMRGETQIPFLFSSCGLSPSYREKRCMLSFSQEGAFCPSLWRKTCLRQRIRSGGNSAETLPQRAERQPRTATFRPFRTFCLSEDSAPSEDSGPSDSSGDSLPSGPFVLRKGRTL